MILARTLKVHENKPVKRVKNTRMEEIEMLSSAIKSHIEHFWMPCSISPDVQ